MPRPSAGEVWLVDLGLAAKVRPCLILSDYPADDELALVVVVPRRGAGPGALCRAGRTADHVVVHRQQALMPIQDHTEMDESLTNVIAKLAAAKDYPKLFRAAFGSPDITAEKIGLALEQFLLTLTSGDSKFDRALRG